MKVIHTSRLVLRPYANEDKQHFIRLLTDSDVMRYVDHGVLTCEQANALWDKLIDTMYPAGIDTIWAVTSMDDERFVGHASVRPRPVKPGDWEISYYLVKDEWGKGFATELAQRLSKYAFEILALPVVYATVVPQNTSSIGVLRKAGFSFHSEESDDIGPYFVYELRQKAFHTVNPSS